MTGAFIYLLWNSWKNRLTARFRRLKQPKYLIGAIFGAAYFYFYFYRFMFNPQRFGQTQGSIINSQNMEWLEPLGALLLFVVLALMAWVFPGERAALVFSEAEVAFLFPAPVARRTLIHYKLLKSQIGILFSVLFLMLIGRRFGAGGVAWIHLAGWWVILSLLSLHRLGASFTRTMLLDEGISNWKRRAIILALLAALVAAVVLWAQRTIPPPDLESMHGVSDAQYYLERALTSGPAPYVLYPFRLVVRPYLQTDMLAFVKALWPALLLLALHYFWVVRSNVAFEEASVEASKKMAERIAAARASRGQATAKPKKKKRAPFKLRPAGSAAIGFLWKNLIGTGQMLTARLLIILMPVVILGAVMGATNSRTSAWFETASILAMMFLCMSVFIGPQLLRHDFRQELPMADLLKTYPLAGWQVALGELLTPVALLSSVQWLLVLFCLGTSSMSNNKSLGIGVFFGPSATIEWRLAVGIGVMLILPFLNFVIFIIPNAAVLLFPAWFQTGPSAPQGIEATGQRLIFAVGQLLALAISLLPAAVVFAGMWIATQFFLGKYIAVIIASAGAALVLGAEGCLGLLWLGRLFERFDVALDGAVS